MLGLYDEDNRLDQQSDPFFSEVRNLSDILGTEYTARPSKKGMKQAPKQKWNDDEDKLLIRSVEIHGSKNWTAVATLVPGRNPKQCRERWTSQLDPNLNKEDWSPSEDATILKNQKFYGNQWAKIATFLPGRSSSSVKNRFNQLSRRNINHNYNESSSPQPKTLSPLAPQLSYETSSPIPMPILGNQSCSEDPPMWGDTPFFDPDNASMDEMFADFDWM